MGRRAGRSSALLRRPAATGRPSSAPRERPPGFEDSLLRDGGQMATCSSQSLGGALLFLGWHLVQTALSTTVIPLCGVNKTENCITTVETVLPTTQMGRETECKPEWQSFCFNGECKYSETLERYYCRCKEGFMGERCSHSNLDLVKRPLSNEYLAFTIIVCLFFFSAILLSIYFYRRYLNKKQRLATSKNYEEVAFCSSCSV